VIAGKLSRLPPFGPAVMKLLSISVDDESAPKLFEDAFMSDPALTAELLVLANSAAYGGRSKVETIGVGIRYLGLERVRAIAATSALRSHTRSSQPDPYLGSVWAHSIATAVAAEALGNACGRRGLYTLGLSKEFQNIEQANRMERNLYGMTHCQAGALMAASWGLPESLAACMGEHHVMPAGSGPRGLIVIACRMADSLGFLEVPLSEPPGWPEPDPALEGFARLEPEALWDDITRRITDLSG
jgi:HD-like signal output (HDOD) protein